MIIIAISALHLWVMGERKGLPSVYLWARSLVEAGHEVHFLTPYRHLWRTDLDEEYRHRRTPEEIYDGIHVHRFAILMLPLLRSLCLVRVPSNKLLRLGRQLVGLLSLGLIWLFFTMSSLWCAIGIARKRPPTVVCAHNGVAAAAGYLLAKMYRVSNITKIYGTFLSQIPWRLWHIILYFPEVLGFRIPCTYLIVDNDGTRGDVIAARLGVPKERLKFWMNGVDKNMYDPRLTVPEAKSRLGLSADTKVLLSLGRLDRWKRVDRLIQATDKIAARYHDVLVLVVGDGNERESYVRLAQTLGVQDSVRFVGAAPREKVADYMHAADIFVTVQDVTNFGINTMEAMVCARCVVALDSGDTGRFIKNNENGILIESDASDRLASAVVELLGDDARRSALGENARRYAEEHFQTWEERMQSEVALVESLARGGAE
jgi:glycosyltransferase involved in cell wall biosynthesis